MSIVFSQGVPYAISCGYFNWFRRETAKRVGIDLDQCQGWGGSDPLPQHDVLIYLFDNQDVDGVIFPSHCKELANRLLDLWQKGEDSLVDHFIEGLFKCHVEQVPMFWGE